MIIEPADPQRVAAGRRYRRIARHVGRFVVDDATCGCHVHVGVSSRELAIQVSNHLRPWLPMLLALSANSPIHHGADTGYASSRYLYGGAGRRPDRRRTWSPKRTTKRSCGACLSPAPRWTAA